MTQYDNEGQFSLWKNKAKESGNTYLTIKFTLNGEEYKVNLFKNDYKKEDKHPDYRGKLEPPPEPRGADKPADDEQDDGVPF